MKGYIKPGLKFRNDHLAGIHEIYAIHQPTNSIDVILPTGHLDKGWNLQHTEHGFERGEYRVIRDYITEAIDWAVMSHKKVNQFYGDYPYEVHLFFADWVGKQFIGLLPDQDQADVRAALIGHDTIEDTRQTFNDVRLAVGPRAANLILACTSPCDYPTRHSRNCVVYPKVRALEYAAFVKLADRIANTAFSRFQRSRMFETYCRELEEFITGISGIDQNMDWFKKMVSMLRIAATENTDQLDTDQLLILQRMQAYYTAAIERFPRVNPDGEVVYLGGGITGKVEESKPVFQMYENHLTSQGYQVLNPHRICAHLDQATTSWETFMETNLPEMLRSKKVFLIPEWKNSNGAALEFFLAWRFKKPVFVLYENDGKIVQERLEITDPKVWEQLIHKITALPLERFGFSISLSVESRTAVS